MGPTSMPRPVNDCKMPFMRASFYSGKTIITILDAVDSKRRLGYLRSSNGSLTGAVEAAEAEALQEATHEGGYGVGGRPLNEVKHAKNQHRDTFAETADN